MDKKILLYIDRVLTNLRRHIQREGLNNRERDKLELRIEVFEEIRNAFEWKTSKEENKQSKRIFQLAKSREQGLDVKHQLNEINLYSKIREVIPYIMAVSYKISMEEKHLTEDLLNFCEKQLEIIDHSTYKNKICFPSKKEVEEAFKCYTERIKPNKIPTLKVYKQPEVNKKIEELYKFFLSLS